MPIIKQTVSEFTPDNERSDDPGILIPISTDVLARLRIHPELISALTAAVSPKPLNLSLTREGLKYSGDRKAFLIVERVIEFLKHQDEAQAVDIEQVIKATTEDALKRDLAFRLVGLMRPIKALNFAQLSFMEDLLTPDTPLILGVGPTGTGKTFMAIAAAISLLAKEEISQIVLTRPHQLIDGDVMTASIRAEREVDEQFAVFNDILHDLIGHSELEKLIARHKIEIAPMGTMRGRTFNNSFLLIDEAQNTTIAKMRMAITRAGQRSRVCITGDPCQVDLPHQHMNGLSHLISMIENKDLGHIHSFERSQIVRSDTVARLEELYALEDPTYFVGISEQQMS